MGVDIATLKSEIDSDPKSLGYADSMVVEETADQLVADKLNEVGASNETVEVDTVTPQEFMAGVVVAEYEALSSAKQRLWGAIISVPVILIRDTNVRAQVGSIWAQGTVTRTNFLAMQEKSATRSEVVFGENVSVSSYEVHKARRL